MSGAGAFAALRRDPLVLALIEACGSTECHLVGGLLRDRALGLATHDFDAVVAGRGREIAELLAHNLPARFVALGGKDFAAYRLVVAPAAARSPSAPLAPAGSAGAKAPVHGAPAIAPGTVLDLWDREATSLHDDLARRDLTVNSFALDPRGGGIVDPFGGLADLASRTLRATTRKSFAGDPLRVLRLVRLMLRLPGFTVEPDTFEKARRAAPRLTEAAAERIRDELWMVLTHAGAARGLRALAALGIYPALWLGTAVAAAGEAKQHPAIDRAAAEIAALPARAADLATLLAGRSRASAVGAGAADGIHDAGVPDAKAGGAAAWEPVDFASARVAASFRPLLLGGGEAPAVAGWVAAGYLSSRQASAIAPLLAQSKELPETEIDRRRFLFHQGRRWLTVACSAGAAATAAGPADLDRWRPAAAQLCELARCEGAALVAPPRLLNGVDVQRLLGIPPGPAVGSALAALTAAQVGGLVRSREDAERWLRGRQASLVD